MERWRDADGDCLGGTEVRWFCRDDVPTDWVDRTGDCNDDDAFAFPGAPERCNERDDDCDGQADEVVYYKDADGDGFPGGAPHVGDVCELGPGEGLRPTDHRDDDPMSYPGAPELCLDGVDNDGDGAGACLQVSFGGVHGGCTTEHRPVQSSSFPGDGAEGSCALTSQAAFAGDPVESTDDSCPEPWTAVRLNSWVGEQAGAYLELTTVGGNAYRVEVAADALAFECHEEHVSVQFALPAGAGGLDLPTDWSLVVGWEDDLGAGSYEDDDHGYDPNDDYGYC